jgi:hypothetical protein
MIARIGKYIFKKNELKAKRQRARSKVGYYRLLLSHHGSSMSSEEAKRRGIRGFARWNKPGKKQELRLLYKKYKIEQMQAEVEMHELVISTRKELNKIRKQMPFNLRCNTDKIIGIRLRNSSPVNDKMLWLKEIEQAVIDQDAENILLKGE